MAFIRSNPFSIILLPLWIIRGAAFFRQRLAERVRLDVAGLPYRSQVLERVRREAAAGCRLLLASTAPLQLARQVAEHLGFFHDVLESDAARRLGGKLPRPWFRPLDAAQPLPAPRRGPEPLEHLPLPAPADDPGCSPALRGALEELGAYLRAIRVHQWLKNVLIFLPLLTRQEWREVDQLVASGIAFLAFSFAASAIYLVNDLLDLAADRRHPIKRHRPLAAGEVTLWQAGLLLHLLLAAALVLALLLPPAFIGVLLVYLAFTIAYSFFLKQVVMVDVVTLAGLYTLRVIAGAAAIAITPSFWLLAFSMFVFLSLALVKRYAELSALAPGRNAARGRDYRRADRVSIYSLGAASGYLSILVLALFINSPELAHDYSRPEVLWLLCPILLYWISRIWIKAGRGEMQEDPLVFALSDHNSRGVLLICLIIVLLAQ